MLLTDEEAFDAVETADCCAFVCFTTSMGERKLLGWANSLIKEIANEEHKKTVEWFIEETEKQLMYHYAKDNYGCRKEDTYTIMIKDKNWQAIKDKARA